MKVNLILSVVVRFIRPNTSDHRRVQWAFPTKSEVRSSLRCSPLTFTFMSTTTYSDRTPKWRSLSSKKKPKAATSVSLIFAQPQQGAPLRSAVDNLPAVGIDDSASFVSEMSRKRERLQSMSSAMTLGDQSFVGKEDSGSVHKRSRVGSIASAAEITPAEQPNLSEAVIDLTKDGA